MRLFICLLLLVCFATSSWAFFAPGRLQNDEPTLLETVSLSINGDFGINKLWVGIKKIAEGVFELIDLKAVRVAVNWVFDTIMPSFGSGEVLTNRVDLLGPDYNVMDIEMEEKATKDKLRSGVTMIIGGLMQKQECWDRSACIIGLAARRHPLAKLSITMAANMLPSWNETIAVVGESVNNPDVNCERYLCNEKIDGRNFRGLK